jgi:hypothetical protein
MQGYYFSRPVSAEKIRHILVTGLTVDNLSIFPFRQFSNHPEIQRIGCRPYNLAVLVDNIPVT